MLSKSFLNFIDLRDSNLLEIVDHFSLEGFDFLKFVEFHGSRGLS